MGALFRSQARDALTRYRNRRRHERKTLTTRAQRKSRTWTDCSQANLMKLRYRHSFLYRQPILSDPWQALISSQIAKYANRIDPLNAWQRREFFILEKMNSERFDQHVNLVHGSAWSFAADMQSSKVARLHRGSRRPRSPRKWWSQVLQNGWFRLRGTKATRLDESRDAWSFALLAFAEGLRSQDSGDAWRGVFYNGFRRLNKRKGAALFGQAIPTSRRAIRSDTEEDRSDHSPPETQPR